MQNSINDCNDRKGTTKKNEKPYKKPKLQAEDEKSPISIKDLLTPIQQNFEANKDDYPVSFSNFMLIMDLAKSNQNCIEDIRDITPDFTGIHKIIVQNYKFLQHRSMKTRFTKLKNKIQTTFPELNLNNETWSDTDQDIIT